MAYQFTVEDLQNSRYIRGEGRVREAEARQYQQDWAEELKRRGWTVTRKTKATIYLRQGTNRRRITVCGSQR